MTMAPVHRRRGGRVRVVVHVKLRELRERHGRPDWELSMGMTNDFELAVEEGSTLVRVGRAIFG